MFCFLRIVVNCSSYSPFFAELMLLGFISLLLNVLEKPIAKICIPKSVGESFLPCENTTASDTEEETKCAELV